MIPQPLRNEYRVIRDTVAVGKQCVHLSSLLTDVVVIDPVETVHTGMTHLESLHLLPSECRRVTEPSVGHHDHIGMTIQVKANLPSVVF